MQCDLVNYPHVAQTFGSWSQRLRTRVTSVNREIPKIHFVPRNRTVNVALRLSTETSSTVRTIDWYFSLPLEFSTTSDAAKIIADEGKLETHSIGENPSESIILISSPFISINLWCPLDRSIQPNCRGNGSSGTADEYPVERGSRRVPMAPFGAHTYSSGVLAASSTESRPVFLWWKCLSDVASLLSLTRLASSRIFLACRINTGMASDRKLERKSTPSFPSAVRVLSPRVFPLFRKFGRDDHRVADV